MSNYSTGATWTYTGMVIDAKEGERPEKTPHQLIATRAIETKDGWLGQIIMSGEIVYETDPQVDDDGEHVRGSELALEAVNTEIQEAFKRLIVGP